jgi:hypothetical protein
MTSQQQLHQLVEKEQDINQAWQLALQKSENEIREYNDKQTEKLNELRSDDELIKAVAELVEKAKKDGQLILVNHQRELKKVLVDLEDRYRQRGGLLEKQIIENFKNKYSN